MLNDVRNDQTREKSAPVVCVYCGAKSGAAPKYAAAARALGAALAQEKMRLVYGAGDLGLMGEISSACRDAGGEAIGFIPRGLWEREITRRELPNIVVTESLHQRKSLMLQNSDALVVLPGGVGTLDEVIEALTWRQIGVHKKPIVFFDLEGYWRPLLTLFEHMAAEGFLHGELNEHFTLAPDVNGTIKTLKSAFSSI
ncbi:MAG: TIGR00730 family Rossman fold protein [Pseudomonadota bacterium]